MNYRIIFRDALQLLRVSKLLWVFGVFYIVCDFVYRVAVHAMEGRPVTCIPALLVLVAFYFSFFARCALIYSVDRIRAEQHPTTSEVWAFCKTKIKSVIGFFFLSFPLLIFAVFIPELIRLSGINLTVAWIVETIITFLITSFFAISICTIAINNLDGGMALWIGLWIMTANFRHVAVLSSIFVLIQILLTLFTGNILFGVFLIVPLTVTMTLAYRVFIAKSSYPGLSNTQSTA